MQVISQWSHRRKWDRYDASGVPRSWATVPPSFFSKKRLGFSWLWLTGRGRTAVKIGNAAPSVQAPESRLSTFAKNPRSAAKTGGGGARGLVLPANHSCTAGQSDRPLSRMEVFSLSPLKTGRDRVELVQSLLRSWREGSRKPPSWKGGYLVVSRIRGKNYMGMLPLSRGMHSLVRKAMPKCRSEPTSLKRAWEAGYASHIQSRISFF